MQCKYAHIELIKRQWLNDSIKHQVKPLVGIITHNSDVCDVGGGGGGGIGGDSNDYCDDRKGMPPHEVFVDWVRCRCRQHAIMLQGWESFEVWPLLKSTLEEKPWLVMLDLEDENTWIKPPKHMIPCVTSAQQPDVDNIAITDLRQSTPPPNHLIQPLTSSLATTPTQAQTQAQTSSSSSSNTMEQSDEAQRRWWLLKNTFSATTAFTPDNQSDNLPVRQEFCKRVRKWYGMIKFLHVYGDVTSLPEQPRLSHFLLFFFFCN